MRSWILILIGTLSGIALCLLVVGYLLTDPYLLHPLRIIAGITVILLTSWSITRMLSGRREKTWLYFGKMKKHRNVAERLYKAV